MRRWTTATAAILAALAAPAWAGDGHDHDHGGAAEAKPPLGALLEHARADASPGEWAEYATLLNGKAQLRDTMRFSIVPDEDPAKSPWIEVWVDKVGRTALRFRRHSEGPATVFIKLGSAIYSITDEETAQTLSCPSGKCRADASTKLETVPVTLRTTAGTHRCRYGKITTAQGPIQIWYAEDVPALQLARLQFSDGKGYELVASGRNAASAFPRRFVANPLPFQNMKALDALVPSLPKAAPAADAGTPAPADAGVP